MNFVNFWIYDVYLLCTNGVSGLFLQIIFNLMNDYTINGGVGQRTIPNEILLPEVARLLSEGISVTLQVKGTSMLPFIVGDRDSVLLAKAKIFRRGDIVLAKISDDRYVLHRIITINDLGAVLRGDGNLTVTEHCLVVNICGKAVKIIRNGRYIKTDSFWEKLKVFSWEVLRPMRRYLLAVYRRIPVLS